ncbi:NAD-dependent epimerase/dehydratase family protein [Acaryochloris sp. IP29b_bin.137]|uniref:NAD-dependent epimerase/dehydratase family protein n=1 Tax=Acaryochloris sp. IP29b_bin.137 TaxID=2969217 RepID=UPI0026198C75|nr:NAD-dependent epimerase/dehydratase family protein [Acaryochloris sp. IP29b_bin.137]
MSSSSLDLFDLQAQDIQNWYVDKTLKDPHRLDFLNLQAQRICVMGGCGQVGSHIITKLYEFGYPLERLTINDDLRLGKRENLPTSLRGQVDIRCHKDYALNPISKPDILIFVGGRSSVPHFHNLADVLEEVDIWKTVLEWCVSENIRLIFASTSSLCKKRPSLEDERVWPGSLYETAKLMMEDMAIQQALCNHLGVQICRFFSVYGVTEQHKGNFGNLYTQVLWHSLEQTPFELWGRQGQFKPGEQTRDTIFAAEVSRALLFLLTLPKPQPQIDNITDLVYNIGQGEPTSIRTMIGHIEALLPSDHQPIIAEVEVPEDIQNYVVHTWGNPRRLLGTNFQPLYTLHPENLKFIAYALLSKMDWYWSIVEHLRQQSLTRP